MSNDNLSSGFEWMPEGDESLKEYGENVIIRMVAGKTTITAIAYDFDDDDSTLTHRVVEIPGKQEAVILVNKDFIDSIVEAHDHPFGAGFAIGIFIGQICTEVGDAVEAEGPNDDWSL